MVNGILNVYKEKGYTSHDVVAKMRGILKIKKIGHTGTLDPDAEGVLPVCIGKATRLVDLITDKDKTYEAVLKLGVVTDTQDLTGQVLKTSEVTVGLPEITKVIESYVGDYEQLPPMYSAIKVNGKKLYELARQGKEIERNTRKVTIYAIRILEYSEADHEIRVSVDCAKGTYIRTLLHDIGETLGCGGAMKSLLRTKVGGFAVENSLTLAKIEELTRCEQLSPYLVRMDEMFPDYVKIIIDREFNKFIYNGNSFIKNHIKDYKPADSKLMEKIVSRNDTKMQDEGEAGEVIRLSEDNQMFRIYDEEDLFIGIYRYDAKEDSFRPVKMFL